MDWNKFISENRAEIDELLGPNNAMYSAIALKGKLAKLLGTEKAMNYFTKIMSSGLDQLEQNNQMRTYLLELRASVHFRDYDHASIDLKMARHHDRTAIIEILRGEFL